MRLLSKIERRLSFLALPNLTVGIVLVQVIAWVAMQTNPALAAGLMLDPALLRAGEWWRIFSFLLLPPASHPLWLFFALYLLWLMGTALEREWGDSRYTLFWLIGWLASIALALFVPFGVVSNVYLTGSVFLAFAFLYPDFELRLFFILPVKVKWLAAITWVSYLLVLSSGIAAGSWAGPAMVAAATLNFFVFFGRDVVGIVGRSHRHMKKKSGALAAAREPFHRCSACRRTDLTDPTLDFRYAQTPDGTRCFCEEHLPGSRATAGG